MKNRVRAKSGKYYNGDSPQGKAVKAAGGGTLPSA